MGKIKEYLKDWSTLEICWFIFSMLLIIGTVIYKTNGFLSDAASICGVIYVLMLAKNIKYAYFFGGVNSMFYGAMLFIQNFYGIAFYNILYCMPMMIYGYINWGRTSSTGNSNGIKRISNKVRIIWAIILIIVIIIGSYMMKFLGSSLPVVDTTLAVLGCFAIFLTANKYIEQWAVWMVVNTVNVVFWFGLTIQNINNIAILLMWVIFFFNSIYGMIQWIKYMKLDEAQNVNQVELCEN